MDRVRQAKSSLMALIVVATLARIGLSSFYFGFHTGDDVEILQAGFMRALGWPYEPWEIRNLLVSDLFVAPVIRLLSALGVESTRTMIWLASAPFILLASVNVWLVFRITRHWLESEGAALLAGGLYAFHWLALGYGSTVYPRTVSTTCVLLAASVLWGTWKLRPKPLLAGGLVGIAWAIRYSEAIFLLPLLATIWLEGERRRDRVLRSATLIAGFSLVSLLTVGLEDWLTWGTPFASLVAFARYTLIERQASSLDPHQPWYWYLWRLPKWLPLTLLPLMWRARRVSRSLVMALFALLPLLTLSAIHHKQLRYLQGVIPFVAILAAAGAWSFWRSGRRSTVKVLAVLSVLLALTGLSFLTKQSMPAVLAAQHLGASPEPGSICLSQSWAYGENLYLGPGAGVRNLPHPLSGAELAGGLGQCATVALYRVDYRRDPSIATVLEQRRYTLAGEYRWGRGKPVLVFRSAASFGLSEVPPE